MIDQAVRSFLPGIIENAISANMGSVVPSEIASYLYDSRDTQIPTGARSKQDIRLAGRISLEGHASKDWLQAML